jgi:hypothetical protein
MKVLVCERVVNKQEIDEQDAMIIDEASEKDEDPGDSEEIDRYGEPAVRNVLKVRFGSVADQKVMVM